jgi:hypothetical protein
VTPFDKLLSVVFTLLDPGHFRQWQAHVAIFLVLFGGLSAFDLTVDGDFSLYAPCLIPFDHISPASDHKSKLLITPRNPLIRCSDL